MIETFMQRFLMCSLAVSILILMLLLIKKGLNRCLPAKWQYHMDMLFFILLAVPFLPSGLLLFLNAGNGWFDRLFSAAAVKTGTGAVSGELAAVPDNGDWLQDFTLSVQHASSGFIAPLLLLIWIAGIAVFTILTFRASRELRLVTESMKPVENGELAVLFAACKAELGIKRNILFGTSILAKSPMAAGLFRTRVILPAGIEKELSQNEIRYILLHELTHCKSRDIPLGYLICVFQILHWFNPLVFLAFHRMRQDRELRCDSLVLQRLPDTEHGSYGKTLLQFIGRLSHSPALSFAADMGGSGKQVKKRIRSIASFAAESGFQRARSIGLMVLVCLLLLCQIPSVAAFGAAGSNTYRFQHKAVVYEDLSSHFGDYEGSFVLYDLDADFYRIYNLDKSMERVSPASTYKIYSALIALDANIIEPGRSEHTWDGTIYPYEVWNHSQDLSSAMQNSVSWYFQNLDAQVGKPKLMDYYRQLSYGNQDLSGGVSDYWMESSLRISPVEQVELLTALVQNDTLFRKEHVDVVKNMLRLSEKDGAVLSGKTGTGAVNGHSINGWFVGFVEANGNTYIFATNISGGDDAGGKAAVQITCSILSDKGIYG